MPPPTTLFFLELPFAIQYREEWKGGFELLICLTSQRWMSISVGVTRYFTQANIASRDQTSTQYNNRTSHVLNTFVLIKLLIWEILWNLFPTCVHWQTSWLGIAFGYVFRSYQAKSIYVARKRFGFEEERYKLSWGRQIFHKQFNKLSFLLRRKCAVQPENFSSQRTPERYFKNKIGRRIFLRLHITHGCCNNNSIVKCCFLRSHSINLFKCF